MMRTESIVKIAALFGMESKVNRDRFSGILRYSTAKRNWEIRNFTATEASEALQQTGEARKALWLPDGLIVVGNQRQYADYRIFCDKILHRRIPCVVIDGSPRTTASHADGEIATDDKVIGIAAADYFIKRGFTRFACVGTRDASEIWHSNIRLSAFGKKVAEDGFGCTTVNSLIPETGKILTIPELASQLKSLESPCAVFAYSDEIARYVLDACRYADIAVPDQLSILGVDDQTEITENTKPPLSSIVPDFESSGFHAAETLDAMIGGEPPPPRQRESRIIGIVERASTQDVRGGGRIVRIALDYIRIHLSESMRTADIARAINVSPRLVEMRFREILDCSVLEKVTALRLENAIRLISKNELSFAQIAYACGYATPDGLKLAFKKKFGLTMSEWRARNACP